MLASHPRRCKVLQWQRRWPCTVRSRHERRGNRSSSCAVHACLRELLGHVTGRSRVLAEEGAGESLLRDVQQVSRVVLEVSQDALRGKQELKEEEEAQRRQDREEKPLVIAASIGRNGQHGLVRAIARHEAMRIIATHLAAQQQGNIKHVGKQPRSHSHHLVVEKGSEEAFTEVESASGSESSPEDGRHLENVYQCSTPV
mmetsp:Transcript_22431/g.50526  ORF Transcript_22431/g.50526 Transcript_22431/m.50526 type:complete len:200 (-) Transcript_22431:257-856(-)